MKRFKNILYVNAKTADQGSAIKRAVTFAVNNQSKLTIIEVIPQGLDAVCFHKKALQSLVKPYQDRLTIDIDVLMGTTFLEIIRTVVRNEHDLVIKLAENPDFVKKLFGSDDMHLLRKCPCPVWFMKPPEKSKYKDIAAAVGFNPLKPLPVLIFLALLWEIPLRPSSISYRVHCLPSNLKGLQHR